MPTVINGTTGITTDGINATSGNTSLTTLNVASNPISAVNSLGFRNRIINGGMVIDQRNGGASVTPADGQYTLDRWVAYRSQASRYSVQQNAGSVTPPTGFTNYAGVVSLSAYSSISTDYFGFSQNIEGFNISDLGWGAAGAQSVTLSFWVRSSLTGTLGGALRNNGNTRTYGFSYSVAAANTWEFKTITIPGDTTGTWVNNNGIGINVWFDLGSGSSLTGSPGSWGATQILRPTGSVSLVGTNGATFYITGVQLEAGTVASPFERRDYGRELIMCQRYYETGSFGYNGSYQSVGSGCVFFSNYVVQKRASATMVAVGASSGNLSSPGLSGGITSFSYGGVAASTGVVVFIGTYTASAEL